MTTNTITRFAPSPTGRLHLGHAWSALLAHDLARNADGRFLLRIEDIDRTRCRPAFAQGIFEDLNWLGLSWDGDVMTQSERMDEYAQVLVKLEERGLLYRCTCTRADIANAASAPQGALGPIYPGTCRHAAIGEDTALPWSWRIDIEKAVATAGPLEWHEEGVGKVRATPEILGDVILARKDAGTSYHLSVTVDDAAQGVTDIVRGRDLFEATHIHRLLQALLGLPTPRYLHHPLIVGSDGERLSKRKSSPTIASLRDSRVDPAAIVSNMRSGVFPIGFALEDA